jgi:predicted Ser/Thr protein kinase
MQARADIDAMEPDHLGKYELRGILGKGATGVVYEAYDPVIERRVAIKTVVLPDHGDAETSDDLARFRREAQAAGRLNHPNIVGVYDYGESELLAFIVMEFVEGVTLKPALEQGERFSIADTVLIMTALLDGLAYSHANGVIHRDIKPANVMLTHDRKIKLADFGVARIESSSLTQAGTMIGTPSYMSPEQFTGHPADARTDLYAAGVLLYQLLTGEKPFEGGISVIMHKVLNVEPPPPSALSPAVPPALDSVVQKAMAKRPEARFATATEFAAALNEAMAQLDVATATMPEADPAVPAPVPVPIRRGRGGIWTGGAIAVFAALILALAVNGLLRWQSSGSSPASAPAAGAASGSKPLVFSLRRIKARIAAAAAPVSCTLLHGKMTARAARLSGLAGQGQIPALQAALRPMPVPVHLKAEQFNGPYCPVLDTVRPYAALFTPARDRLQLGLVNETTTLVDGQLIMPQLRLPDYASYLEVDYFTHGGSVFHLYPTPAAPQAVQPASGLLVLGNPKTGGANWVAGPPHGTDMILAIATSLPLFSADRLQSEPDQPYLAALRAALRRVRAAKGKISVSVILLKTVAASDAPTIVFGGKPVTETRPPPPPRTALAAPAK